MLDAAEALLGEAPDSDVSTRAVCDAVGVGQPVLYRLFGDKRGLLAALVDRGFDRYVDQKQSLVATDDPVADLTAGWDDHMGFAHRNPALYRLMFSPALTPTPAAAGRIFALLSAQLDRCAAVGATRIPSDRAAQAILSANVGVALSQLSQPERYDDPDLSLRMRDAVFAACLRQPDRPVRPADAGVAAAALQLDAQVRADPTVLEHEERELLLKWLARLGRGPAS